MPQIRTSFIFLVSFSLLFSGCQHLRQLSPPFSTPKGIDEPAPPETVLPEKKPDEPLAVKEESPKTSPPEISEQPTEPPEEKEAIAPEKTDDLARVVSYFRFLNALPEKAIQQEHERTQQEFNENKNTVNRLRLAMVLGLTNSSSRDANRSLSLLEDVLKDPDPDQEPMLSDFSFFLFTMIQKLKTEVQQRQNLSQKLLEKDNENKTLEKMIEELKTIEKNIMERDHSG